MQTSPTSHMINPTITQLEKKERRTKSESAMHMKIWMTIVKCEWNGNEHRPTSHMGSTNGKPSHNWKRKERRTKSVERFTIVKCEWNGNEHDQPHGKHLSDVGFDTTNFHGPTPGSMRSSSKEQSSDPLSEPPGTDETGQAMTVMPTLEKSFNINT